MNKADRQRMNRKRKMDLTKPIPVTKQCEQGLVPLKIDNKTTLLVKPTDKRLCKKSAKSKD